MHSHSQNYILYLLNNAMCRCKCRINVTKWLLLHPMGAVHSIAHRYKYTSIYIIDNIIYACRIWTGQRSQQNSRPGNEQGARGLSGNEAETLYKTRRRLTSGHALSTQKTPHHFICLNAALVLIQLRVG